ncbi:MAG TPA: iron ABC transporter permease, partial [Trueperaceae bacterium]|nr:iron ABC transporter permease [Trueperaceae bacterium]
MARRPLVVVASVAVLVVLALLSFGVGTKPLAPSTTWDAIFAFDPANSDHLLVRYLRLPRTALAVVVGCCLGVAGTVMQALTRNALADPGILGVNAGAAAAIAAAIAFFGVTSVTSYMWFGLLGAAVAGVAVYFLGGMRRGSSPVRLVLAGAALSIVLLALTQVVIVNSEETVFDQFRHWTVGSLQGRGTSVVLPVTLLALVGVATSFVLARALNAAVLGEEVARSLGANPVRVWSLAALAVILTSGAATAAAGPVGFVGLT